MKESKLKYNQFGAISTFNKQSCTRHARLDRELLEETWSISLDWKFYRYILLPPVFDKPVCRASGGYAQLVECKIVALDNEKWVQVERVIKIISRQIVCFVHHLVCYAL